ncbi:helix-turn-helix domain-containing protein, partial [Bradyrhizobium sp. LeoA1S1]
MNVRYRVELSQAERDELTAMLGGGKHAARKLKRAQILLAADRGRSDEEIARTVSVSRSTVSRTKRRFVEGNLERALSEEPRPGAERKLTGKEEALLVATACAENAATVQALLDNLVSRGLDPTVPRLFIADGAKALSKAIRRTFGSAAA